MISRLRYRWSTSPVATAGALLGLSATIYVTVERLDVWRGDWWWGYNNLAQALPLLMILVSIAAGWQAGSPTSGLRSHLERGPVSPIGAVTGVAMIPLGGAIASYLAGVVGVVILTITYSGCIDPRIALILPAHLSAVILSSAVGLAVGATVPTPYSAPVAGGAVGAMLFVTPPGGESIFALTGPVAPVVGAVPSLTFHFVLLSSCALATAALLAYTARRRQSTRPLAIAGAISVAALLVGCYVVPPDIFDASDVEASRCYRGDVTVCVYPGYDRVLATAAGQLAQLRRMASEQGLEPSPFPDTFRQFGGSRLPVGVGTLTIDDDVRRDGRLSASDLALSLVDPLWCPAMFAETPPIRLLQHRDEVYDWLLWLQGDLPESELRARYPRLGSAPAAQWAAIIGESMRQIRACAGPTG